MKLKRILKAIRQHFGEYATLFIRYDKPTGEYFGRIDTPDGMSGFCFLSLAALYSRLDLTKRDKCAERIIK